MIFFENSLGVLWDSLGVLWKFYAMSLGVLWNSLGFFGSSSGVLQEFFWSHLGALFKFFWSTHGVLLEFFWSYTGVLWEIFMSKVRQFSYLLFKNHRHKNIWFVQGLELDVIHNKLLFSSPPKEISDPPMQWISPFFIP